MTLQTGTIRLVIADDHIIFIEGLRRLLEDETGIAVIGEAHTGKDLLSLLKTKRADIVLMDINMPVMNGLDATRHLKLTSPEVSIVILSTYHEDHLVEKAKRLGANGYLLKNCSREELLVCIKQVANGGSVFPEIRPRVVYSRDVNDSFVKQFSLTKREMELLRLIREGSTNKDMAENLFLSIHTVETHRKNIMQKLGLNNPAALMKFLVENGI